MIPKKIHYFWFGDKELPDFAKRCIQSWKEYFPDHEIIQWNEKNFDINCCEYVKEAYRLKKWAFVSDYARLKILYEYGGIYFDTDVEVIKSFDNILKKGSYFGMESDITKYYKDCINPGVGFACEPKMNIMKEIIDTYEKDSFILNGKENLKTIGERTTEICIQGFTIYPKDYFCPIDYRTKEKQLTENTYSIHHYDASWISKEWKKVMDVQAKFGQDSIISYLYLIYYKVMNKLKRRKECKKG